MPKNPGGRSMFAGRTAESTPLSPNTKCIHVVLVISRNDACTSKLIAYAGVR